MSLCDQNWLTIVVRCLFPPVCGKLGEWDKYGFHIVGYFSKEKQSAKNYNLACTPIAMHATNSMETAHQLLQDECSVNFEQKLAEIWYAPFSNERNKRWGDKCFGSWSPSPPLRLIMPPVYLGPWSTRICSWVFLFSDETTARFPCCADCIPFEVSWHYPASSGKAMENSSFPFLIICLS